MIASLFGFHGVMGAWIVVIIAFCAFALCGTAGGDDQ